MEEKLEATPKMAFYRYSAKYITGTENNTVIMFTFSAVLYHIDYECKTVQAYVEHLDFCSHSKTGKSLLPDHKNQSFSKIFKSPLRGLKGHQLSLLRLKIGLEVFPTAKTGFPPIFKKSMFFLSRPFFLLYSSIFFIVSAILFNPSCI